MPKVAIITGGASGMGLAVATALSQHHDEWAVHIIDLNATQGTTAARTINAHFHQCDITDYNCLSTIFHLIYQTNQRLDFVHANAGIVENTGFQADGADASDGPPPPPDMTVIEINIKAVVTTSWLAMHYFRLTQKTLGDTWEGNLVMTASIAGLYATYVRPMYTVAKYGVVGLTRALAPGAKADHNVRVNCICPGMVRTGMTAEMEIKPEDETPISNIQAAVMMLIEGKGGTDSAGVDVAEGMVYGKAVEVVQTWWRWREMDPYPDARMGVLLGDEWGFGRVQSVLPS